VALADAGPVVVALEPEAPRALAANDSIAELHQRGARFEPAFLAVSVGQPVRMPNQDTIFHNVFSYSRPNHFDLGLYPAGESRTIRFAAPGPVRIYCSIHEDMNGLIYVAPSRLFARPDARGDFRIEKVPAGRYRLHVWSERLPELVLPIAFAAGEQLRRELALGGAGQPPPP